MSHFSRKFYEILKTKLDDFKRFPKPVHYRICLNFSKWQQKKWIERFEIKEFLTFGYDSLSRHTNDALSFAGFSVGI